MHCSRRLTTVAKKEQVKTEAVNTNHPTVLPDYCHGCPKTHRCFPVMTGGVSTYGFLVLIPVRRYQDGEQISALRVASLHASCLVCCRAM